MSYLRQKVNCNGMITNRRIVISTPKKNEVEIKKISSLLTPQPPNTSVPTPSAPSARPTLANESCAQIPHLDPPTRTLDGDRATSPLLPSAPSTSTLPPRSLLPSPPSPFPSSPPLTTPPSPPPPSTSCLLSGWDNHLDLLWAPSAGRDSSKSSSRRLRGRRPIGCGREEFLTRCTCGATCRNRGSGGGHQDLESALCLRRRRSFSPRPMAAPNCHEIPDYFRWRASA
jgi:hypothetical protein